MFRKRKNRTDRNSISLTANFNDRSSSNMLKNKEKKRYRDGEYGRIYLCEINKILDSDRVTNLEKLIPNN